MPKKREKNEVEYQKSIVRQLKKRLRQQEKRIKELERSQHIYENKKDEEPLEQIPEPQLITCPACGKGKLVEYNVVGRYWLECNSCLYRTKTKYV